MFHRFVFASVSAVMLVTPALAAPVRASQADSLAGQNSAPTTLLEPPVDELGIAIQEALRASLNVSWSRPCGSISQKERSDATGKRFGQMKPLAEARLGKDRLGILVGQVFIDLRTVSFAVCSDPEGVERQITGFEAAVERLDTALSEANKTRAP